MPKPANVSLCPPDPGSCQWSKAHVKFFELMKACLNFSDILGVGRPQVEELQKIGDAYEGPEVPGACEAFTRQVRIVEGILVQTYGIAVAMAKKAEDLDEVAEIWAA